MFISRDASALARIMNPQPTQTTDPALASRISGDNFQDVLKDLLSKTQSVSTPSSAASPMNQEQLMLLVRAMQIQMNSSLYNTLFNHALESNVLAAQVTKNYGGQISHFVQEASKNGQTTPKKNPNLPNLNVERIIQEAAQKFDVDANLIRSVIRAESDFNPSATSPKGAMGLMQLMPETAGDLGVKNAYDPRENVMGGTRYLKMLIDRYDGQVDLALAAYNWGMGNLEKKPDQLPQETLAYVEKVRSYLNKNV
jgi:soluble lytic murein transglycosylase-like protein